MRSEIFFMIPLKRENRTRAPAIMTSVVIRAVWLRKVNSKRLRVNGMRKAPATMVMIERMSPVRSGLKGREIQ